jgi:hypothetical protein
MSKLLCQTNTKGECLILKLYITYTKQWHRILDQFSIYEWLLSSVETEDPWSHELLSDKEYDLFRCVHDINAHTRVKGQFTPDGEQQAYLEHKKLYSADAIRALFTETQGQGNWVNFNSESGEDNIKYQETGELDKLSFPDQKAFLYPDGIIF